MGVRGQGGHCKDRGVRKRRERGSTFNPSGGFELSVLSHNNNIVLY